MRVARPQALRAIWLCADDYGMAPGVSKGIRQLIEQGRLNATSVMTAAKHFTPDEAQALRTLNDSSPKASIGLHVTLTGPFTPLTQGFAPLREGAFPRIPEMMKLAMTGKLTLAPCIAEIAAQMRVFIDAFGRAPDFVDGHQHVHLLPTVRRAFVQVVAEYAPNAWVRQCARPRGGRPLHDTKGLVLDVLSLGFRGGAARHGLVMNPAFAGAYDFATKEPFVRIFPGFLKGLPDGGLIMCHPGFVDETLVALDPLTTQREHEFAFFASDAFPEVLAAHGVMLAVPSGES